DLTYYSFMLVSKMKADAKQSYTVNSQYINELCCLLLTVVSVVMNRQTADLNNLTVQNQQLIAHRSMLEKQNAELSRDRDNYNWTLGFILQFNTFPVNAYCPQRKCQPCQGGWIWFQEKCYLFYNEIPPWKTWDQSRQYCQSTAADLVVVDSPQEQVRCTTILLIQVLTSVFCVWRYWIKESLGTTGPCALMIPGRNFNDSWDPAACIMLNKFICEGQVLIKPN
uniref:C-type lectin domain-containing protein n=1 Tax=Mastacembelus armatus TaxID=205130 RepID=A0A3Q3LL75_9TELE